VHGHKENGIIKYYIYSITLSPSGKAPAGNTGIVKIKTPDGKYYLFFKKMIV
jgi:hypothetical protein